MENINWYDILILVGVPLDLNVDKQIPEDKFLVSGADLYKGREEIIEQKLAMYQAILIAAIKDVPGFQDYLNTTLENSLAIVDQINSYTNDQNKFNNDFDNQYADWKDKNNSGGNTSGNNGGCNEA